MNGPPSTDILVVEVSQQLLELLMHCLLVSVVLLFMTVVILIFCCCWEAVREGRTHDRAHGRFSSEPAA